MVVTVRVIKINIINTLSKINEFQKCFKCAGINQSRVGSCKKQLKI